MTDHDHDLMQRLAAADPVDPGQLPSAGDRAPQHLLETIMGLDRPEAQPIAGTGATAEDPATVVQVSHGSGAEAPARWRRRSRVYLAAVAAAVLLLLATVAVFAPGSTAPALATVHSAAQATADADSGRIAVTFSLSGTDGQEAGRLAGEVEVSYSGADLAVAVAVDDVAGPLAPTEVPAIEARLVDGVAYLSDGNGWYSVATNGLIGQAIVDYADPRSVLPTVQELTETTEIGPAEVEGVATTHYRSAVDLGDESLARSGWLATDMGGIETGGEVVIDLFVDDTGLLRRLDVSGDVSEAPATGNQATFTVSTSFTDFGADIVIEAPAGAVQLDSLEELDFGG